MPTSDDRTTRKRIEAMKEKLDERLQSLKTRRDDMLTIEEIGVDQLIVDEAQEFRKLSFATNRVNLKGVDPDGSQRAWDLFVKSRFIDERNPGRALIQSSGTPITNTLGEMYTLLRFQAAEALRVRGIHEFDAWASAFGDTRTELELQPSGSLQAGRALQRVRQRPRADRHFPLRRRRGSEGRPASVPEAAGAEGRAAAAHHRSGERGIPRLSAHPRRADHGDRAADAPRSEGR